MKFRKTIYIFILFVVILFSFSVFDIYASKSDLFLGGFFAKIIPFPAVYYNGTYISFNDYENFLNDYKIYFLFDKSINKDKYVGSAVKQIMGINFIQKMSKKLNVKCDKNEEYAEFKNSFYAENNIDKNVILKLKNNLGFKEEKFEEYVIFPSFCRIKISEKLPTLKDNIDQRKKIDEIYSDIAKNPDKFIEYSDKYNDKDINSIKKFGFLPKKDLPQSLRDIIDNMSVGDLSPVIQSISGYHIYKIESIILDEEKDQKFYEFSQIFLEIKNLNDYIEEYLVNGKFKILVP